MRFFGKSLRTPNMGPKLPILTIAGLLAVGLAILAAIAQAPTSQGPETTQVAGERAGGAAARGHSERQSEAQSEHRVTPPADAQRLLEHAILTLEGRRSVLAKIRHSADLFDQRPVGSGVYLEQRSERGLLLRFEARTQLADEPSSLLQVCDGRYLWVYQRLGDDESLSRIDVARVQQKLEESGKIHSIADVGWWPGLGGLSGLLRAIHSAFAFHAVEEAQLASQDGPLPVWRLRGQWKPDRLARWLPDQKPPKRALPRDPNKLPRHLPDHVVLYLGKTDVFPYRIEYRRRAPDREASESGSPDHSIVTIQFFYVDLDASIHPALFLYNPGDHECVDRTAEFLKDLDLPP
jgi:hypothetical protein